jgi:DNA-binding ferritin-like protein
LGNAIKYISRAGRKQDYQGQDQLDKTIEDLKKSVWYINHEIERLEALDKK